MARFARSIGTLGLIVVTVSTASLVTTSRVSAAALSNVSQITAGQNHACALLTSGRARCWGSNLYGQVGDGSKEDRDTAVVVSNAGGTGPLKGIGHIAAGPQHTCVVLASGQARCWGHNGGGQLGDGTKDERTRPVTVLNPAGTGPLRRVTALAAGDVHTCALLESKLVRCWGSNSFGQLGDGTNDERPLPTLVKDPSGSGPLTGVTGIDSGLYHTCARLASRRVVCWGGDPNGELGNGEPKSNSPLPVAVLKPSGPGSLARVAAVDLGEYHACALLASGRVRCWGFGGEGALGNGFSDDASRPVVVKDTNGTGQLEDVSRLAAGGSDTCGRLETRRARCWGLDEDGQLGDGTPSPYSALPVIVRNAGGGKLSRILEIAVGYAFTCARFTNHMVRCWGLNDNGQLGDGTFDESHVPVAVIV